MVTFWLKDPNAKDTTLIYMVLHYRGKKMKMSTGKVIKPADWNQAARLARKNAHQSDTLNKYLRRLKTVAEDELTRLQAEGTPITPAILRVAIQKTINGTSTTFVQFIAEKIETLKASADTKRLYRTRLNRLKDYPKQKDFDDITEKWLENYQEWLEGKGYTANYVGKNVGFVIEYLNKAVECGLISTRANGPAKYKKPSEQAETIYLNDYELLHLYNVDLPPYLDRVRDRFLIGCYTGLRFSDFSKIKPESVRDGMIVDKNKKTGTVVVIPIHWVVGQILTKYGNQLPPSISNQKSNDYIKEIALKAGIVQIIAKNQTKGGKVITTNFKKYELVTTHTARRSFATNAYLSGIPAISIMKITGHKTEASFLRYIRISSEENARLLSTHPFFLP